MQVSRRRRSAVGFTAPPSLLLLHFYRVGRRTWFVHLPECIMEAVAGVAQTDNVVARFCGGPVLPCLRREAQLHVSGLLHSGPRPPVPVHAGTRGSL